MSIRSEILHLLNINSHTETRELAGTIVLPVSFTGFQGHFHVRIGAVGIVGGPSGRLAVDGVGILFPFVHPRVARGQPLVHGFGIDEEFERGAGLAHGGDFVIFP